MAPLDHGGLAIREKADAAVEATKPRPGAEIEYGKPMRELFLFSPGFRNLNHGMVYPAHLTPPTLTNIVQALSGLSRAPSRQNSAATRT